MPQNDNLEKREINPLKLKLKSSSGKKPLTEGTVPPKMPPKPKDNNE